MTASAAVPVRAAVALLTCLAVAGCSTNVSRFQMPGTDLEAIEVLYVRAPQSTPEDIELFGMLRAEVRKYGYEFEIIDADTQYGDADARFEYKADWHWDITTYLLELRVAVYEPDDDTLIAQAHSLQTSLARKETAEVVGRAVATLFAGSPPGESKE